MTTCLNIDDLKKRLGLHAMCISQVGNKSAQDKRFVYAVLDDLDAIELGAWGMPEIAAQAHTVRKPLQVQSK